jgi:hypothetical protein
MGQLYMQRFEYRGAISKSEFDEAWRCCNPRAYLFQVVHPALLSLAPARARLGRQNSAFATA